MVLSNTKCKCVCKTLGKNSGTSKNLAYTWKTMIQSWSCWSLTCWTKILYIYITWRSIICSSSSSNWVTFPLLWEIIIFCEFLQENLSAFYSNQFPAVITFLLLAFVLKMYISFSNFLSRHDHKKDQKRPETHIHKWSLLFFPCCICWKSPGLALHPHR